MDDHPRKKPEKTTCHTVSRPSQSMRSVRHPRRRVAARRRLAQSMWSAASLGTGDRPVQVLLWMEFVKQRVNGFV
jgi:hypothetical protein